MKQALLAISAFIFVFAFTFVSADEKSEEAVIKTSAQCGMCKEKIEDAVNELDGIIKADLEVETAELSVEYDPEETDLDEIKKAVSYAGYDADDVEANKKAYHNLPKCCQKGGHKHK